MVCVGVHWCIVHCVQFVCEVCVGAVVYCALCAVCVVVCVGAVVYCADGVCGMCRCSGVLCSGCVWYVWVQWCIVHCVQLVCVVYVWVQWCIVQLLCVVGICVLVYCSLCVVCGVLCYVRCG